MIKGIIFDLDMTLVNTHTLFDLRKRRQWSIVYNKLNETILFKGITEMIEDIKEKYKYGIVTSSPASYANKVIAYHNLNIPLLVAYHDTQSHKPDPEPIIKGVEMLGIKPEKVISIGDECKDIIASIKAGTISAAVTWGIESKEALLRERPNYIFSSVSELRNFFL